MEDAFRFVSQSAPERLLRRIRTSRQSVIQRSTDLAQAKTILVIFANGKSAPCLKIGFLFFGMSILLGCDCVLRSGFSVCHRFYPGPAAGKPKTPNASRDLVLANYRHQRAFAPQSRARRSGFRLSGKFVFNCEMLVKTSLSLLAST